MQSRSCDVKKSMIPMKISEGLGDWGDSWRPSADVCHERTIQASSTADVGGVAERSVSLPCEGPRWVAAQFRWSKGDQ